MKIEEHPKKRVASNSEKNLPRALEALGKKYNKRLVILRWLT
jgi:hypothetical protein